jgi:hypothetical protein
MVLKGASGVIKCVQYPVHRRMSRVAVATVPTLTSDACACELDCNDEEDADLASAFAAIAAHRRTAVSCVAKTAEAAAPTRSDIVVGEQNPETEQTTTKRETKAKRTNAKKNQPALITADKPQFLHHEQEWWRPVSSRAHQALSDSGALDHLDGLKDSPATDEWFTMAPSADTGKSRSLPSELLGTKAQPLAKGVYYFAPDLAHALIDERLHRLGMQTLRNDYAQRSKIEIAPNRLLIVPDADTYQTELLDKAEFCTDKTITTKIAWDTVRTKYDAILFAAQITTLRSDTTTVSPRTNAHVAFERFAPNTLMVFTDKIIRTTTEYSPLRTGADTDTDRSALATVLARSLLSLNNLDTPIRAYGCKTVYPIRSSNENNQNAKVATVPFIEYGQTLEYAHVRRSSKPHSHKMRGRSSWTPREITSDWSHTVTIPRRNGNQTGVGSFNITVANVFPYWVLGKSSVNEEQIATAAKIWNNTRDLRLHNPDNESQEWSAARFARTVQMSIDRTNTPYKMQPFLELSTGGKKLKAIMDEQKTDAVCELSFSGNGGLPSVDVVVMSE